MFGLHKKNPAVKKKFMIGQNVIHFAGRLKFMIKSNQISSTTALVNRFCVKKNVLTLTTKEYFIVISGKLKEIAAD